MFACFPISGKSCQCELAPIHQRLSLSLSLLFWRRRRLANLWKWDYFWVLMSSIVCPAGNFTPSKSNNIGRCARMLRKDDERVTRHQKCILGTTITYIDTKEVKKKSKEINQLCFLSGIWWIVSSGKVIQYCGIIICFLIYANKLSSCSSLGHRLLAWESVLLTRNGVLHLTRFTRSRRRISKSTDTQNKGPD